MTLIAWDIETCPRPYNALPEAQQERLGQEQTRLLDREPSLSEKEARKKAASLHPHLGWICCIAAVRGTATEAKEPKRWVAGSPDEEPPLLKEFWADVQAVGRRAQKQAGPLRWVTFNGKRFDVPFLTARTAAAGLEPTRTDLIKTHPFRHSPHADLMTLWQEPNYSLKGLSSFLGAGRKEPSADGSEPPIDGSMVARLVDEGRLEEVADYCAQDAIQTLRCAQKLTGLL